MKKTLVWLLALLLTAALPASAAERFEVTDGVYVALPDVFVAYTRDSVQDKQSDFLGVDVSLLTELIRRQGGACGRRRRDGYAHQLISLYPIRRPFQSPKSPTTRIDQFILEPQSAQ